MDSSIILKINGNKNTGVVYVNQERLDIKISQRLRNHSEGFSWGYLGSGCSQLALAILLKYTSIDFAKANYMAFKERYVSKWNVSQDVAVTINLTEFVQNQKEKNNC